MADRIHTITSPFADDLYLLSMKVREELGRPFVITVEMVSEEFDLNSDDILGASLTVKIDYSEDGEPRYFNGLVSRFSNLGTYGGYARYQAVLRPWLWMLSRTSNCRIFQEKSAPDILEQIFKDENGFSDFRRSLTETYRTWEYCVQYRESDFEFVSRLMEQEGIYYFFEHEEDKHTLVLADSSGAHSPIAGESEIPFREPGEAQVDLEHVSRWTVSSEVHPTTYVLDDYDFTKPKANLESKSVVSRRHAHGSHQLYDFPGEFREASEGERYAKIRIQAVQAQHKRIDAVSDCRGIAAGGLFTLKEFPREDQNAEHLVVSTDIEITSGEVEQFAADAENTFEAKMQVIGSDTPFRALATTPKPLIAGPQSAVVVGKSGEEIWTDKYGRVKVQFYWDRVGQSDENSSCWVRVCQYWAGNTWGSIHIPRIGQEVIVEFEEGDPDRPIVTGRVYNEDLPPPYQLPDNQTQSGVKSRSTKQGTTETFNELRFEDLKDSEEIYFHAQKNFNRVVENDDTLKVGFDTKDKGDQTIEIHNNRKLTVGNSESDDGSQTIEVWNNHQETIKEGNRDVIVDKGNDTHHVKQGNREIKIDQGNDTITITQGDQTIKISAGKGTIEAGTSLELKVGGSSIKIEPAAITIKSTQVTITADAALKASGATAEVSGSATLTLKGGMVQIN